MVVGEKIQKYSPNAGEFNGDEYHGRKDPNITLSLKQTQATSHFWPFTVTQTIQVSTSLNPMPLQEWLAQHW